MWTRLLTQSVSDSDHYWSATLVFLDPPTSQRRLAILLCWSFSFFVFPPHLYFHRCLVRSFLQGRARHVFASLGWRLYQCLAPLNLVHRPLRRHAACQCRRRGHFVEACLCFRHFRDASWIGPLKRLSVHQPSAILDLASILELDYPFEGDSLRMSGTPNVKWNKRDWKSEKPLKIAWTKFRSRDIYYISKKGNIDIQ